MDIISPYWNNNSCSPFYTDGTCTLGHLASYIINVTDSDDVIAGVEFARKNNIRLTIKNTGHDYLGRSTGAGALALWTHNMKYITFLDYSSPYYSGSAVSVGAGVQGFELLEAARRQGLRTVGGDCPTVGVAGGWSQGGGHGHLGSAYGLGADNILEFEVVTSGGKLMTASPVENGDLYWALSGGGPGNYAIVISMILKAYPDTSVAGARLSFKNTDQDVFWSAVEAWMNQLLLLNTITGMSAIANFNNQYFGIDFATLPNATADTMAAALEPFVQKLNNLDVHLDLKEITSHPTYQEHYDHFTAFSYDTNNTLGSRLIPRSTVENQLPDLISFFKSVVTESDAGLAILGGNYTHLRVGNDPGSNAVHPAWRDSLACLNFFLPLPEDAPWELINQHQKLVNKWQDQFKGLAHGGGAYMNEATYDNPDWKVDYFGENYNRLLSIKKKYDPEHVFWANAAVGSDEVWALAPDGRLCQK